VVLVPDDHLAALWVALSSCPGLRQCTSRYPATGVGVQVRARTPSRVPVGGHSNADALLDVARGFLNTAPEDRSGEDGTQVVVHVSADSLAGNVPA
jgi:hypothetical protein